MFNSRAVGRISLEGNEANAITARKAVPPAWPTVAYRSETAPKRSVSMSLRHSQLHGAVLPAEPSQSSLVWAQPISDHSSNSTAKPRGRPALRADLDLRQVKLRDIGTPQKAVWTATSRNVDLVEATRSLADRGPIATADVLKMKANQLHISVLKISRERMFSRQRPATYARVGGDSIANLRR